MKPDDVLRSIEAEAPKRGLPIIGPVRGAILDEVVAEYKPNRVLEIGTLVGYSAIRIGRLLRDGGHITCVDINPSTAKVAASNIAKAGLSDRIEIIVGDAKSVIPRLTGELDMVFLDAEKHEYLTYLRGCERLLHRGSVVVADNVKTRSDQAADYLDYVRNSGFYTSSYREEKPSPARPLTDAVEVSVKK